MKQFVRMFLLVAALCLQWGVKAQCTLIPVTVECHDNCGDGWNGCALDVYQGGILRERVTLESGSYSLVDVDVCLGNDSVYFIWVAGSWANEVSFTIFNPNGADSLVGSGENHTDGDTVCALLPSAANVCIMPAELTVSQITTGGALVQWQNQINTGATYTVTLLARGDSIVQEHTGVVGTSLQLSNLLPNTPYTVQVMTCCSATQTSRARSTEFRTLCNSMLTLPYSEGWEYENETPWENCWTLICNGNYCSGWQWMWGPYNTETRGIVLRSWGDTTWVISQSVPLPGNRINVRFMNNRNGGQMRAGVMTDPSDPSTFIPLYVQDYDCCGWVESEFNTAGLDSTATYHVAWMTFSEYGQDASLIDDIVITEYNGCNQPMKKWVEWVGTYDAQVRWTSAPGAEGYRLYYGSDPTGADCDSVTLTDTTYVFDNLRANTLYYIWVNNLCDIAYHRFLGAFQTPMTCVQVQTMQTEDVAQTAARIAWTYQENYGYAPTEVRLELTNLDDSTAAQTVTFTTGTRHLFAGLIPGTHYRVRLANICATFGTHVDTSDMTELFFTTDSCVGCTTTPTCLAPMPEIVSVVGAAPTLQWPRLGTESSFVAAYSVAGSELWVVAGTTSDTLCTFTSLASSTQYRLRIGSLCDGDTVWSTPFGFTTPCPTMQLPWSDNFEGDTLGGQPLCWNVVGTTDYYGDTYPRVVQRDSSYGHSLAIIGQGNTIVASGVIPLRGDSIMVRCRALASYTNWGDMKIGVMTNPYDASTFVSRCVVDNWDWTKFIFNTSDLDSTATYYLAFRYYSNDPWRYMYIDNVEIQADDGCRVFEMNNLWYDSTHATVQIHHENATNNDYLIRYWEQTENSQTTILNGTTDGSSYYEVHISGLTSETPYAVEVGTVCSGDTSWRGNWGFTTTATCPRVANLRVADSTTNSITLAWSGFEGFENYRIAFGNDESIFYDIYDTTVTIDGLADGTEYTFSVYSYCNNIWMYGEPVTITAHTKAVPPVEQYPYTTTFDNASDNQNWQFYNHNNSWYIGHAVGNGDSAALYISNDGGATNQYYTYSTTVSYAIRKLHISEASEYAVKFDWRADGESNYDYIRAWLAPANISLAAGQLPDGSTSTWGYTTTTPEGWIDLGGKMNGSAEWATSLGASLLAAGDYKLVFMWANDGSAGTQPPAAIDNLSVVQYTCSAVASVMATEGIHEAVLSWIDTLPNAGATYSIVHDGQTVATGITGTTYTISGLDASTLYTYGVVRHCSPNDSSYPVEVSFTTRCERITAPYTCGFESDETPDNNIPYCWHRYNSAGSSYPRINTYNGRNESQSLYFYFNGYSSDSMMAILPEVNLAGSSMAGHHLVFFTRMSNYNELHLQVGTMSDPGDPSTFTVDSLLTLYEAGETEHMIPLGIHSPDSNQFVAFLVSGMQNYNSLYIDDVLFDVIPSCLRPERFEAWNSYADSMQLVWSVGNASSWEIEAMSNDTTIIFTVDTSEITLTYDSLAQYVVSPLQPYREYRFRIRAVCGDSYSYWPAWPTTTWTLNNETDITLFSLTNLSREATVIDTAAHTVTVPIYYSDNLTNEEGSYTLSYGAWMQVLDDAGEWNNVNELPDILRHAWQNVPLTVRVYAQDAKYFTDWTLLFVGEACTRISQLKAQPERTVINLTWEETDPAAGPFQLVISPTPLSSDALEVAQKTIISQKTYREEGLERNTSYYIYMRADCGYCLSGWTMLETKTLDLVMCGDTIIGDSLSTSNSYHTPLNNYYNYTLTETLLYADELEDLVSIEGISYYYDYYNPSTVKGDVRIYLQPTEKTSFVSSNDIVLLDTATAVLVYSGSMDMPQGWNSIVFDEPYTYEGGNLMVIVDDNSGHYNGSSYRFRCSETEDYTTLEWYSDSYNPDPLHPENYSGSKAYYRYRALMRVYGCHITDACPSVGAVTVDNIGTTDATVHWMASDADYLNHYEVFVSSVPVEDPDNWSGNLAYSGTALNCTLTGLEAYTDYYVYVRANCVNSGRDEGTSTWQEAQFKTFSECRTVADLTIRLAGKHEAVASWRQQGSVANYEYVLSEVELGDVQLESATLTATGITDTAVLLTGLANSQTYYFYIRNNCGSGTSPWMSTSLTTYEAMPAVVGLHAEGVSYNAFTAVWQGDASRYADETAWRVALSFGGADPAGWSTVHAASHIFYGLTADTVYRVYVAAYDSASGATSDTVSISVNTLPLPADCADVAVGAESNGYLPLYGAYTDNHQRMQSVYPAEMLVSVLGKTITSMSYSVTSGGSSGWNTALWEVSIGVTPSADVSAEWADTAVLTRVYTGTLMASPEEGMSVVFDQPFVYTGGNLLVQFVEREGHPSWSSCYFRGALALGASRYAYPGNGSDLMSATGSVQDFLPQVRFCYEHESDCYAVSRVFFNNTTAHTTDVVWYMGNNESEWQWAAGGSRWTVDSAESHAATVANHELTLTGLTAETDYRFFVRPVCDTDSYGEWSVFGFTTQPSCGLPDTLWADNIAANSAVLHAEGVALGTPQSYTFRYWPLWGDTTSVVSNSDAVSLTGLTGNTDYRFDVQVHCGDDGDSRWTTSYGEFHTPCGSTGLPYYHHFSWDNSCWTFMSDNSMNQVENGGYCYGTGIRFSSANTLRSGTYNQYAFSPVIDSTVNTPQKVVVEYATEGSNNRLWIGYTMSDNTLAPDDYTWSNTYFTSTNECDLRQAQLFLPMGVRRVAVRYYGTHAGNAYIYSVNISEPASYNLSVAVDTTRGAFEGPTGTLYEGTDVTLTATPLHGYQFYNWSNEWGGPLSTENPYSFTLSGDMWLRANFIINKYNVTAVSSNTMMGTVSGGGRVDYLTPMTLSASSYYGYHFSHWSNGDSIPTMTVTADSNITLVAYFDYNRYAIVGSSADEVMGTVIGSDTVNFLTEVTLTAIPNYGYHFVGWNNGDTASVLEFTAVENRSLTANFAPNPYAVTGLTNNAAMGTVSGSATVNYLTPVTLTATPNYGYHFVGWSNGESTETITITAVCDTMVTALFDYNSYSVVASSNDTVMGTVSGSATVNYLDSVTLTATANYGYHFTGWSNGITADTLRLQVTADLNVIANFTYNQYTVSVTTSTPGRGSVSGGATVNYLTPVVLNATPFYGYRFTGWTGDIDSNDAFAMPMVVVADRDRAIVATFDTIVYNVTANVNNPTMGTVSGADSTRHFATAHLVAHANYGYHFVSWTNTAGNILGVASSLNISPVSDTTVRANFTYNQYTVAGVASDALMGTVSGSATVNYLDSVTLTATAGICYHFVGWSNGDTARTITIAALSDSTLTAFFAVNVYEDSVEYTTCDNYTWNGQNYTQSGVYPYQTFTANGCDSTITLTLTVNYSGADTSFVTTCDSYLWRDSLYTTTGLYTFDTLTVMGCDSVVALSLTVNYSATTILDTVADISFMWEDSVYTEDTVIVSHYTTVAGCDSTVTVNLTVIPWYTITLLTDSTMGSVDGAGFYAEGTVVTLTATSYAQRHFMVWSDGVTDNPRVITVEGDTTITAFFDYDSTVLVVEVNDTAMGTVAPQMGGQTFHVGDTVVLTAIPATNHVFVAWVYDGDTLDNADSVLSFMITTEMAGTTIAIEAVFKSTVGIAAVEEAVAEINVSEGRIVITGMQRQDVNIFDVTGRLMYHRSQASGTVDYAVRNTGVYLVKVGNAAAKRVVVVR